MSHTVVRASQKLLPLLSAIKGRVPKGASWGKEGFSRLALPGPSGWAAKALIQLRGACCLGCCSCCKGYSCGTSWAGVPGPFPGTQASASYFQVLPPCFPFPYALCSGDAKASRIDHIVLNLCACCFLSLECLYSVLPLGKLLLILQNLAQTSLPPGSSRASFPGEFITPFST